MNIYLLVPCLEDRNIRRKVLLFFCEECLTVSGEQYLFTS